MPKALLIQSRPSAQPTGDFAPFFGGNGGASTEAHGQFSASEAATLSKLYFNITGGGNATNTVQMRKNTGNGQLVASRSNVGTAEDVVHEDDLSAADLFNIAFTDTGTDPIYGVIRANVEFASGYGSFFGTTGLSGIIYDAPSTTRYISLTGSLSADGNTTEAVAAFKFHGARSFPAFQVFVISNARTTDTLIRNRINGANGTGLITIPALSAAETLYTVTGLSDAIADGQTANLSIEYGAGVEDLVLSFVGVALKSSIGELDIWGGLGSGEARAASATPSYYCIGGALNASATEADRSVAPGFALDARSLRIYVAANTYSTDATLTLESAGAPAMTVTITAGAANQWFDPTPTPAAIGASDLLSYKIVGGTTGSITTHMIGFTYAPTTVSGGQAARTMHQRRLRRVA